MFLRPGTVLDAPWTGDVGRFVEQPARYGASGGVPARRPVAVRAARDRWR